MLSLLVGLVVIASLSGAVIYQVNKLKKQTQTALNESLKNYAMTLEKGNVGFYFSPFECGGLFQIRCKSPKAIFLRENSLLLSASNVLLSLEDFDSRSLRAGFSFVVDDMQKGEGLENYFEVLMPEKVKGSVRLSLQKNSDLLSETNVSLSAKNLDYKIRFDSKLVSEMLKDRGLFKYPFENLTRDPIYFVKIDFNLIAKSLDSALFDVIKKQYGTEISREDYQGFLSFMIALGQDQFSFSPVIVEMIRGFGELALGQKQNLSLSAIPQGEICLNCEPLTLERLKSIANQSQIDIAVQ